MAISPGTRIGPYEVKSPLGEGGMGVVFRARDTKLQRDVALKMLPDHFASDPDRLGRFQREAQVLASVTHPNIAQIYGFEETGGSGCIVMELVEGETLAERLKRGALPIDEAVPVARQIADALEAAHERDVIHRDLKPANIKLMPDGNVKVLDFGLAKVLGNANAVTDLSNSPTLVSGSMPGVVLGTAAYMSPEQARGKTVDRRTDIWAFGCVLFEMLTGRQVFEGETAADIIAKIVAGQPDWSLLPPDTPQSLRSLLPAVLNKDAKSRLQHIGDARLFLDGISASEAQSSVALPARSRHSVWMIITAALAIALIAALIPAVLYFRRPPVEPSVMRFELPAPGLTSALVISPDGQRIAYVALIEGKRQIWIRPLGSLAAQPLSGTENVADGTAFWSPDSRYLAFIADGKLKKVSASGGVPQVLCDALVTVPGAWGRDGTILFSAPAGGSLAVIARVSASGGEATPVTTYDPSQRTRIHGAPQFLPDGRHFLFHAANVASDQRNLEKAALSLGSFDDPKLQKLVMDLGPLGDSSGNSAAFYTAPGYLLFTRNRTLMAQRFDLDGFTLTGDAVPLAEQARVFSVSENGVLVYWKYPGPAAPAAGRQLLWFDRRGKPAGTVRSSSNYANPRLSPDGHRVAVDTAESGSRDIWTIDLTPGEPVAHRRTFDPAPDQWPVWAPDGARLAFGSPRGDNLLSWKLYQASASGAGADELLFAGNSSELVIPQDWSADGRYIIFSRSNAVGTGAVDLWALPTFGDKKPFPLLQSPARKVQAQLSPDGRWLAYTSNESGEYQIVVQPFPDPTKGKWQITSKGGIEPRWRRDGRELFYLALGGEVMAVPIKSGSVFESGPPAPLFQTPLQVAGNPTNFRYDVTADGQRFLINAPLTPSPSNQSTIQTITAIVNWTAALGKK